VTSLLWWRPHQNDQLPAAWVAFLDQARQFWRDSVSGVPQRGRLAEVDFSGVTPQPSPQEQERLRRYQNFLEILGMNAVSTSYAVRPLLGPRFVMNLFVQLNQDQQLMDLSDQARRVRQVLAQVGLWDPNHPNYWQRLGDPEFDPQLTRSLFYPYAVPVLSPVIQHGPLTNKPLDPNYIQQILLDEQMHYRRLHQRRNFPFTFKNGRDPLLFILLRYAALLEFTAVAFDALLQAGLLDPEDLWEPELVGFAGQKRPTPPEIADKFINDLLNGNADDFNRRLPARSRLTITPALLQEFDEFWDSLQYLAQLPGHTLAELLPETLDLAGHRLDAWITSIASRRLKTLRQQQPEGVHLGGYGWVENLSPRSEPAVTDGYLHAPSVNHAATAAVLRGGYLSHRSGSAPADHPLALDLSSARVRQARQILSGLRHGQALGALLGYRFERGLHEGHPNVELHLVILQVRKYAPLAGGKREESQASKEAIAPTNVVDGLTLLRRWQDKGAQAVFNEIGLTDPAKQEAVRTEIEKLEALVDSVSDLLQAESVHQLVMGNPTGSGVSLDAVSRGEAPPPELDVIRTPRTGATVTHRICVLGSGQATPPAAWPTNDHQVRAPAEPHLNAWLAALLPDPDRVRGTAEILDQAETVLQTQTVKLSDLALSPLDTLYMLAEGRGQAASELDQRLVYHLLQTWSGAEDPETLTVRLTLQQAPPATDGQPHLPFAAFLETVAKLRSALTAARSLDARDLAQSESQPDPNLDQQELQARADAAKKAFRAARKALRTPFAIPDGMDLSPLDLAQDETLTNPLDDGQAAQKNLLDLPAGREIEPAVKALDHPATNQLGPVREALVGLAYFGFQGAMPVSPAGDSAEARAALSAQARSLSGQVDRRLRELQATSNPLEELQILFGRGFQVLPRVNPPNARELATAFSASTSLQGGDPLASVVWFQQVAHVREAAGRLDEAILYAEALTGQTLLAFEVAQVPFESGQRWNGLSHPPDQTVTGGVSLVAYTPQGLDAAQPVVGLLVDEWTEVVPHQEETTGLTFQYNAPGNRAPQAVLLAVPPNAQPWSLNKLTNILLETFELLKMRVVDPDSLDQVGHFLPALYLQDEISVPTRDREG
jgi:hypothetical protein